MGLHSRAPCGAHGSSATKKQNKSTKDIYYNIKLLIKKLVLSFPLSSLSRLQDVQNRTEESTIPLVLKKNISIFCNLVTVKLEI